jgi:hypothetical protein
MAAASCTLFTSINWIYLKICFCICSHRGVIPVKTGIQRFRPFLDTRFRGYDGIVEKQQF